MTLHLAEIVQAVPSETHAVVIIDGASWHSESGALWVPDNLSWLRLPPYSSELNAQENIWQFLRQNFLAGRVFDTYEAIVDACCIAWNALAAETGRIHSIAARDWLPSVCSQTGWYYAPGCSPIAVFRKRNRCSA
jgi:hypothetical protein